MTQSYPDWIATFKYCHVLAILPSAMSVLPINMGPIGSGSLAAVSEQPQWTVVNGGSAVES